LKQRSLVVAVTVGLVAGLSFPSCAQQAGIAVAPDRTNQEAHSAELDKAERAAAEVPPPTSYSQTLRERIKTATVLVTFAVGAFFRTYKVVNAVPGIPHRSGMVARYSICFA
jgi:hypothetical protein